MVTWVPPRMFPLAGLIPKINGERSARRAGGEVAGVAVAAALATSEYRAGRTPEVTLTVRVVVAVPPIGTVTGDGMKLAVTSAGKAGVGVADIVTIPAKLLSEVS